MGSFVAQAIALLLLCGSAWSGFVGTYQFCQILDVGSDFRLFWNPTGGTSALTSEVVAYQTSLGQQKPTAGLDSGVHSLIISLRVSTVPSASVAMNYANFTLAYYGFSATRTGQNSNNATGQIYYGSWAGSSTGSSAAFGIPTQTGVHGSQVFANIFYENCRTCAEYYIVPV